MSIEITVVVTAGEQRSKLEQCLESLSNQTIPASRYEVVVVAGGGARCDSDFLDNYKPSFPFRFMISDGREHGSAKIIGSREASSEIILFLDDDMRASPSLIEIHLGCHQESRQLILGSLKFSDAFRKNSYTRHVENDLRRRRERRAVQCLSAWNEPIAGGNISVKKTILADADSDDAGSEIGFRLIQKNVETDYNRDALAYIGSPPSLDEDLSRSFSRGRTYVSAQRKTPEIIWQCSPVLENRPGLATACLRNLIFRRQPGGYWRWSRAEQALRKVTAVGELLHLTPLLSGLYSALLEFSFWRGANEEAGGDLRRYEPRRISILCYHDVTDAVNRRFRLYMLPVARFKQQIDWLKKHHYEAISLAALYDYLTRGVPLPARPIVITFDDGYRT